MDAHRGFPMKRQIVVTCIATLKKSHDEEKAVSCLILGVLKFEYSDKEIAHFRFERLEPVCCKKQQNKFLTSYWFAEKGTSEGPE